MHLAFSTWHQFIAMNGYGRYVWAAYGLAFVVVLYLSLRPTIRKHRLKKKHHTNASHP